MRRSVRHVLCLALLVIGSPARAEEPATIKDGSVVAIEYTATLDDGSIAVSTVGREPIRIHVGIGEILPALETALLGMAAGQSKELSLKPAEAFGAVDPEFFIEVPLEQVPADLRQVDNMIMGQDESGRQRYFRIHELAADHVVLDGNHPLAGKNLHFDLKVLSVE